MKKSFLLFLFGIAFSLTSFAQQTVVKGSVLDGTTGEPIPDVTVTIEETGQTLKTDARGEFSFTQNVPLGEQVLKIEKVGYVTKRYPIIVNEGQTVDISGMTLDFDSSDKKDLFIISISDDNLNGEDDGLTDNVSGLLQASRDVFLSAAAFDFSAAFFRPRGLDNANGKVLINGVEMNKQLNGRPQWGNWGGLNDVQRNQEFTMGTAANDYNFGDLAGTNNIMMRASKYRRGGRVSYASANRSYQGRIMASYSSGLLEGGWSYSFLGSRRFGEEGYIDGTLYDANSFFVAVEKQLGEKHSLNFTGIYAQNRRGRSTPLTQEIFELKGRRYNPRWGIQDGEQRNASIREIEEPILMLNHYWDVTSKVKLNTNVSYQFGEFADTRLDFFGARFDEENGQLYGGARNPTPEHWRFLPSNFLRGSNPSQGDYQAAFFAREEFVNDGQLDWNQFYEANILNGYNIFALQANVNRDQQWTFNSIIDAEVSDNIRINGNVNYRYLNSENFARIEDLLGGPGYLDVNIPFNDGEGFGLPVETFSQSNVRTPNRIVGESDKYSYHYDINANVLSSFVQAQFKYNKVDFYVGGSVSNTSYQREGFYENGFFQNDFTINQTRVNSFGESEKVDFTNYGVKGGLTYKITGKHLIDVNASHFTKAPGIRQSFGNARQNNLIITDLESETINSVDASYIFRSPIIKARLTGYYTTFEDGTEVNFFFSESVGNLAQEIIQNIGRRNFGGELGIEAQVTPTIKLKGAAAMGQFTFTNNPDVYYSSDRYVDLSFEDGTTQLEDLRVSSGPERVFQIGFEYRDPDFWNFGVTTNFFSHAYVDPSALKRSGVFVQDPDAYDLDQILAQNNDGVVNISGFGFADYDEDIARDLLRQERFDDYMLVNLTGGKSWKINDYFVGFFATINNVFNQDYRTGGFEQARIIDYRNQLEEQNNTGGPRFGNRYFFGNGTTYYLNVYLRF